jgi:hypothetical protein
MRRDKSVDAPTDVIVRAVRLFRTARTATPSNLRRIFATLQFDSARPTPALGVRAQQSRARQLLYHAEAYDLDLRVTLADAMWIVKGQVLGPCTGGLVELRGVTDTAPIMLDELCMFTLPQVSPGSYTLTLRLPDVTLELPPLELGS